MHNTQLSLDLFDFNLPNELIAQEPLQDKLATKMLHLNGDMIIDKKLSDLIDYLQSGDLLIFNNTKVIPAFLVGKKGEAKISINLHTQYNDYIWICFVKNSKRLKINDEIIFANDFKAIVRNKDANGSIMLEFINKENLPLIDCLYKYGHTPLPPYIKRDSFLESDKKNYQSIFAHIDGAVAAPTASLHFNDGIVERLKLKGVKFAFVTLHVGAGTFAPVKVDNILDHKIHSEWGQINQETIDAINFAKKNNNKVVSIGTTCARVLEYVHLKHDKLVPFSGNIDLFIYPSFQFNVIDTLITNFHLPKSTLFMLVCAFCGVNNMQKAYAHAIANKYRFFSYGDFCLLNKGVL